VLAQLACTNIDAELRFLGGRRLHKRRLRQPRKCGRIPSSYLRTVQPLRGSGGPYALRIAMTKSRSLFLSRSRCAYRQNDAKRPFTIRAPSGTRRDTGRPSPRYGGSLADLSGRNSLVSDQEAEFRQRLRSLRLDLANRFLLLATTVVWLNASLCQPLSRCQRGQSLTFLACDAGVASIVHRLDLVGTDLADHVLPGPR
jgi:hypothetical protein